MSALPKLICIVGEYKSIYWVSTIVYIIAAARATMANYKSVRLSMFKYVNEYVDAGAQCCIELRNFSDAIQWCDEGLKLNPTDKKLLELRAAADKHKVHSLLSSPDSQLKVLKRGCIALLTFTDTNFSQAQTNLCPCFVPQRAAERDARKAKAKEKKLHGEKEALLAAIKVGVQATVPELTLSK